MMRPKELFDDVLRSIYEKTPVDISFCPIQPDGSNRKIWRLRSESDSFILIYNPNPETSDNGLTENHSYLYIRRYLEETGAPVPGLISANIKNGWIVVEDLGDVKLQKVVKASPSRNEISRLYKTIIRELINIQKEGGNSFDQNEVHNPHYSPEFARKREFEYFIDSFIRDYMGAEKAGQNQALLEEVEDILNNAFGGSAFFCFMHRDFQSRNIMLHNERPYFIDFQGGRLGLPQYDIASLLLDPYVQLDPELRADLLNYYMQEWTRLDPALAADLSRRYQFVSVLRAMQILGAFGHLITKKKRAFFKPYLRPAADNLLVLLASGDQLKPYKHLKKLAEDMTSHLDRHGLPKPA